MTKKIEIREIARADVEELRPLYAQAFPDEDLYPLVSALHEDTEATISLAAIDEARIVGHVVFTLCTVSSAPHKVALLGPLAVTPDRQRQGIGRALIRDGDERLKVENINRVFVLGDPAYYGRFGFAPDFDVAPPYALPEEWHGAWQSRALNSDAPVQTGTLEPPTPWLQPNLWLPEADSGNADD